MRTPRLPTIGGTFLSRRRTVELRPLRVLVESACELISVRKASMSKRAAWILSLVLMASGVSAAEQRYRSGFDVVLSPDGKTVYVSDRTAGCVVILDAATGKKTGEVALKGRPAGLAISADGRTLYAAESGAASVAVIDTAGRKVTGRIGVARRPAGLALAPKVKRLFVCNADANDVSVIDTAAGKEIKRIPLVREPMFADLTADEKSLVVANALPLGSMNDPTLGPVVSAVDVAGLKVLKNIKLPYGATNVRGIRVSPDGKWAYTVHTVSRFNVPTTQLERGWMNTSGLTVIDLAKGEPVVTVLLDHLNEGAADPFGIVLTKDGRRMYVTLGGVHQVAIVEIGKLHEMLAGKIPEPLRKKKPYDLGMQNLWAEVDKSAEARAGLMNDLTAMYVAGLLQRVETDGNGPRGLALSADGKKLWIAHYFSGDVVVMDAATGKRLANYALGTQPKEDVVRQGERLFHDASICFQHWQSCSTCHPEARMDGLRWDLLNDGIGNPKKTRSLVMSCKTAPVMSKGVRENMEAGVAGGFRHILFVVRPQSELDAVAEYLRSIKPEPSPFLGKDGKPTAAAERGRKIFEGKGACAACHTGPLHTDMKAYDVGTLGEFDRKGDKFYTPKLIELYRTAPYLHDGRAATLKEVLTVYNKNDAHGKTSKLTPQELNDLVAYLLSL